MAKVTQFVRITANTVRSNHFQFIKLVTCRRNLLRSWKTYKLVLFLSTSFHHGPSASRNFLRGPLLSAALLLAVAKASALAMSAAVARRMEGVRLAGGARTTGIVDASVWNSYSAPPLITGRRDDLIESTGRALNRNAPDAHHTT